MANPTLQNQIPHPGVTLRAIIIGLLLIPPNTYFIMANHLKFWSTLPTTMSLIYNVIITLMVLIPFNLLLNRFLPRFALRQGELLTVFVMLSLSSAIAGHDMMQTVIPTITDAYWFATPENEWRQLFWRHLPAWLTFNDEVSMKGFYDGESTIYTMANLKGWLRPILWWTIFLTVLIWVMICLDVFLRRQWIERERLSYPIVQLPLEMTRLDGRLFKSRMMWLGFAIAGGINLINGFHVLFPEIPEIPVRHAELGQYFTQKPWKSIGWTPVYIRSFAVGLAYLMPLEMSFSIWFFYWFWKAQRVLGSALGLDVMPGFPYDWQQVMGGYLVLACFALWAGRRYFFAVLKHVFRGYHSPGEIDDSREPMRYRWATIGLACGLFFLFTFSRQGGMQLWTIALYFLIYYLLAMSLTRIRAEVGPPTIRTYATPHDILTDIFGTRLLSHGSLTMMRLYLTFNRGSRAHPMPHTLEGFKLAEEAGMRSGRLIVAMMCAAVIGILASFWAYLLVGYQIGVVSDLGTGGYNLLQSWIYYPVDTDVPAVIFIGVGALFTGFFWWLRTIFPFWPFHPAAYMVAGEKSTIGRLWFSILISWGVKMILLKVGGIRLYRKAYPLFLGLILGEFIIGGIWVLIRLYTGMEMYSFYR